MSGALLDQTTSTATFERQYRGASGFEGLRQQAWADFQRQGIPTRHDEEWRFTPLRTLAETTFFEADGDLVRFDTLAAPEGVCRLCFVNGVFDPSRSALNLLPAGVTFGLASEMSSDLEAKVGSLARTDAAPFAALNTACFGDVAWLRVAKGTPSEIAIEFLFLTESTDRPAVVHPRLLVVVEPFAQASIIERYESVGTVLVNAVVEIYLAEGAQLEHSLIQLESDSAHHIATTKARQERDSVWTHNNIGFGARIARNDIDTYLNGENVHAWLNGLAVASGEQLLDSHTRIDHAMPNCNTFEVYKHVLDGRASAVFNGKIFVHQDAQKTDAKQTNQTLLLSPAATINSKPQLEIFADDVKCTHGATVGQLREDALFYLRARGIPESEARALLVYAFGGEVLEHITLESLRAEMEERLFAKVRTRYELPGRDGAD
ncbi:MAG: Fe-S cluster assembly protein SufD [Fimbriimonadaceae bacterium]